MRNQSNATFILNRKKIADTEIFTQKNTSDIAERESRNIIFAHWKKEQAKMEEKQEVFQALTIVCHGLRSLLFYGDLTIHSKSLPSGSISLQFLFVTITRSYEEYKIFKNNASNSFPFDASTSRNMKNKESSELFVPFQLFCLIHSQILLS